MSKTAQKWIHLIVSCILSAMLIGLGIALIISCLDIYNSGPKPYTPESIAAHFQKISLLVYLTVACVVLGIVLFLLGGGNVKEIPAFVGLGTIVTAFFMGPLIEVFNVKVSGPLLNETTSQ